MKTCTKCNQEQPESNFHKHRVSNTGRVRLRSICIQCENAQQRDLQRRRREEAAKLKQMEQERIEREKAARAKYMAQPRTFSYLKSSDCWTGHAERQYVRNNGLKDIPSKGVVG